MRKYAIFRYKEFPKRTPRDIKMATYQSEKQTVHEALRLNKEAGDWGTRYYWRRLEDSEYELKPKRVG